MREHKLHVTLLAHVLWYVREKTVLHKVITLWNASDATQIPPRQNDPLDNKFPHMDMSRIRKFSTIARRWKHRKSGMTRQGSVITPPELRNASALLRSDKAEEDKEGTAQDMCCISCMRVLQLWIDTDSFAHKDIEDLFKRFGYESQIAYMSTLEADCILDVFQTTSNLIWTINAQGQAAVVMGKKSFISTSLTSLLSPGELVMNVKLALGDAHASDRTTVCPIDPADMEASLSSTHESYTGAGFSLSLSSHEPSAAKKDDLVVMAAPDHCCCQVAEQTTNSSMLSHTLQMGECAMSPAPPPEPAPLSCRKPRRSPSKSSSYVRQVLPPSAPPGYALIATEERDARNDQGSSLDAHRADASPRLSERYVLRDGINYRKGTTQAGASVIIQTPHDRRALAKVDEHVHTTHERFRDNAKFLVPSPPKSSLTSSSRPVPSRRVTVSEAHSSSSNDLRPSPRCRTQRQSFIEHRFTGDMDDETVEEPLSSLHATEEAPMLGDALASTMLLPNAETNLSGILRDEESQILVNTAILCPPRTPLSAPALGSMEAIPPSEHEISVSKFRVEDEDYLPGGLYYTAPATEDNIPSSYHRFTATQAQPILDSVAQSVAQELAELQYNEKSHPNTANRTMHTVSEVDNEEDDEEKDRCVGMPSDDEETNRIRHIHVVVNQLIEEESSILTELSSRPEYRASMGPSRDPLLPQEESKGRKPALASPRSHDVKSKAIASNSSPLSYRMAMYQQKEKDIMTLQGLAIRNSVISPQEHEESVSDMKNEGVHFSLPRI